MFGFHKVVISNHDICSGLLKPLQLRQAAACWRRRGLGYIFHAKRGATEKKIAIRFWSGSPADGPGASRKRCRCYLLEKFNSLPVAQRRLLFLLFLFFPLHLRRRAAKTPALRRQNEQKKKALKKTLTVFQGARLSKISLFFVFVFYVELERSRPTSFSHRLQLK